MLVGFGIVLLAAGAVVSFVVDAQISDADLVTAGWLLMVVGAASVAIGAIRAATWMSAPGDGFDPERQVPTGGRGVEETPT